MPDLLSHIPHGRASATSVPALAQATGLSERECRAEIERLVVEEHHPICTLPRPKGVFLALDPDEIDHAQAQLRSRAGHMLKRARALRLAREELAWAPTLFGFAELVDVKARKGVGYEAPQQESRLLRSGPRS